MAGQTKTSKSKKTAPSKAPSRARRPLRREVGSLVCFFLAVFCGLSLFGVKAPVLNLLEALCKGSIGRGFAVLPFVLLLAAYILLFHRGRPVAARVWCMLLTPVVVGLFIDLFWFGQTYNEDFSQLVDQLIVTGRDMQSGGLVSGLLAIGLKTAVSPVGAAVVAAAAFLFLAVTALQLNPAKWAGHLHRRPVRAYPEPEPAPAFAAAPPVRQTYPARGDKLSREARRRMVDIPIDDHTLAAAPEPAADVTPAAPEPAPKPGKAARSPAEAKAAADKGKAARPAAVAPWDPDPELDGDVPYRVPPLSILAVGKPGATVDGSGELKMNAARLLETIKSFGIEARIVSVTRGPTVARYELELDRGIKLSRLTGLSDDIALSLGASGVRIAPVPGKMSVVGIEVPNKLVSIVYLRDVLAAPEFAKHESRLAFAVGKDIGGSAIVCDLSKLTHLLIAGTTGSGKSVCMNSLIVSLLYKASPDEVRMVMIDPKMVELGVYNGIPHLEVPVVTDPKKAAGALHKVVMEMESRYQRFMERHVRDIFAYNLSVADDPDIPRIPQMVVIIDELADLMLVAAKEVEESICRVAQKARAAGIHLVIATQRPSADVITGLMKANIPSRIAFAVASQLESRIILDTMGAEKLVGRGDMLLYPLGAPKPSRVQGCLITSAEVEQVVESVKRYGEARYSAEFMADIEKFAESVGRKGGLSASSASAESGLEDEDEMLPAAIELVLETGQASTSFLQRRLKLGFARAARLVDQMEERGIVGPSEGSKPRQLLISRQQWQEIQMRREAMDN